MIIGLCGPAGAGKNTVADHLCRRHKCAQFGFADPVYRAVSAATGVPVEELRDRNTKEKPIDWLGKSPRVLLQTLGTDWGRQTVRDDIWVQIAMRQAAALEKYLKGSGCVVITDVRFENEAAAIKERGGVVWRVVRGGSQCLSSDAQRHSSEAGLPEYLVDDEIDNAGSLADLAEAADAAYARLHKAKMAV